MSTSGQSEARTLRARLSHPIIDADGHWLEYGPVMREEFRRIGGEAAVEALAVASARVPDALKMSVAERARRRVGMEAFWSSPSENVLDRATAMLPPLMYERLDDLGIDFSVVYPTAGLSYHRMQDPRLRRAICRAYNVFTADQFRGLEDRVIPAAIIVYEGEGEQTFHAGDCVLQPAGIVHNELECSDDVEILEIYSPAVHETLKVERMPEAAAAH